MCTPNGRPGRVSGRGDPALAGRAPDARAQQVALVARAKRAQLLGAHRYRLEWEDLEDCFSQATLELLAHVRSGGAFTDSRHVANALELRFDSRVRDRRRAIFGRSPIQTALRDALPFDGVGGETVPVADRHADVEQLVLARDYLRRVRRAAAELTPDQRLALACELDAETSREQFCQATGWTTAKYRKVAQRARARLRRLIAQDEQTAT